MKYSIPAGSHFTSSLHFGITFKTAVTKTVRFSPSCANYVSDDINKLFGLSDGLDIHQDSIRIGWRGEGDRISLWLYSYSGGIRNMEQITTVRANSPLIATVEIQGSYYAVHISINGIYYYQAVASRKSKWWGPRVFLRPYFGGDLPAQETIEIDLI